MNLSIKEHVPLAPLTTINVGGQAQFFVSVRTVDELKEALTYAKEQQLPVHILGGGSNTIFSDQGFTGLVIHVALKGVTTTEQGEDVIVTLAAGEIWKDVVDWCVNKTFAGIECLAGIPGYAGAVPMQNVGAYGQEVSHTIVSVTCLDMTTLEAITFSNNECGFAYRTSRFKTRDAGKYIITEVTFLLKKNGLATIHYPEVQKAVEAHPGFGQTQSPSERLKIVRDTVLLLRKKKSMLFDLADPNSRSCGSFFTNPVISPDVFETVQKRWNTMGHSEDIPFFPAGEHIKLSAAFLIEQSGFPKGFRYKKVGISDNHTLAIVNYGGTAQDILDLANMITEKVNATFGVRLEREPVFIA